MGSGHWVFARILAKPNNGSNGETRSNVILYPNEVKYAYNDDPNNPLPDFGDYTEPDDDLLALGVIVGPNIYTPGQDYQFYRFENPTSKGKGKSKAVDITPLFVYTGWVVHQDLDVNGDGVIDINDVPEGDYDGNPSTLDNRDYNNDGSVNEDDVNAWLTDKSMEDPPMAWYFVQEWILNIADLVVTEQGLENDGTKLLQIRFYPVDTTEYQGRGHIIVEKQIVPDGDATLFTFDADYYAMNFSLADNGTNDSGGLLPGIYNIVELVPDDWIVGRIEIVDPSEDSTWSSNTATINLAAGEIVRIVFYNEQSQ